MEWINVDFAVPPDQRNVLVRTFYQWVSEYDLNKKRSHTEIYIASRIAFKNGNIKWRHKSGGYISNHSSEIKVTHWMPLPEQPK